MRRIVLVRHAAATGQDANAPLTIEGQRQASALADLLLHFQIQRVISSPFVRATESVGPFCRRADLRVETDYRLVERVLSARNLPVYASRDRERRDRRIVNGEIAVVNAEIGNVNA